jgi:hypothetical protein
VLQLSFFVHAYGSGEVMVMMADGLLVVPLPGDPAALVRRPRGRRLELWSDTVRHAVRGLAFRRREHLQSLPQDYCKARLKSVSWFCEIFSLRKYMRYGEAMF